MNEGQSIQNNFFKLLRKRTPYKTFIKMKYRRKKEIKLNSIIYNTRGINNVFYRSALNSICVKLYSIIYCKVTFHAIEYKFNMTLSGISVDAFANIYTFYQ